MSKMVYYSDVKILKKSLKNKIKNIFKFFLILLTLVGCFGGASFFSKALTVGNLSSLVVYGETKIKIPQSSFYAITMGEYTEKSEAEKVALGTMVQGAAGFVWENKSKYYVIGNVYANQEDANMVKENLKDSKYNLGTMQIEFPGINIDFSQYDNSDMNSIKKSFEIFDHVYKKIYDLSISFDKGEITHLAVSSELSGLRGEVKAIIVSVQNLLNISSSNLSKVQNALVKLDELLDQSIIKTIDNTSTNYSLKYSIVSCVKLKYDLFWELK